MMETDHRPQDPTPLDTLDYIAALTANLVEIAERSGFEVLAYLLKIAKAEADLLVRELGDDGHLSSSGNCGAVRTLS